MIKQAVASHVVSGPDPRQAEIIAAFDAAVSGQMRSLLHHPHFQALEAAWRGVDFLLRNVDTDESLLRLPYGRGADGIDHFAFEEMPPKSEHDALLWGNPALIATLLLATSWRDAGWSFSPPVNAEVNGLPVHIFTESGEKKLTPCGEVLLTDRVAENLLALGVMPLASVRDRDAVRLLRFQSIAQPATGLAGL